MKRAALLAVLALAAACAAPRTSVVSVAPVAPAPAPPPPPPPPAVVNPNFILTVSELVPTPEDDGVSYTQVFVDGVDAGHTPIGPKSQTRTLPLKLPAGNRLIRLEQWNLPPVGEWTPIPAADQPRRRFVRVEDGKIALVDLRFSLDEDSYTLGIAHEDAPPASAAAAPGVPAPPSSSTGAAPVPPTAP
ncbi:MAG: hypothetical protein KGM24_13110 [Elusimicrobia bacterium]|nr:hypothetical protein [Elusimicrobiota bacterium]